MTYPRENKTYPIYPDVEVELISPNDLDDVERVNNWKNGRDD